MQYIMKHRLEDMYFDLLLYAVVLGFGMLEVKSITLRQECPIGEVHRSCSFNSEYTCWTTADRLERVKEVSRRLSHCQAGCFCKKGLVREYPQGPCLQAAGCRDRKLQAVLKKIPIIDIWSM